MDKQIESIFVNYVQNGSPSEFNSYVWAEAILIHFYTNRLNTERYNDRIKLIEKDGDVDKLTFTTSITGAANQKELIDKMIRISSNDYSFRYGLDYLLNKIDLLEKFT